MSGENKLMPAMSGVTRFRFADEVPPPRGVKLLIYTTGGVSIVSDWSDESNHLAWAPLPHKPVRELRLMDQHDTTVRVGVQWTEDPDRGID